MSGTWIEINRVAVAEGYVMRPGQQIVLVAAIGFSASSARFSILDAAGNTVLGPKEAFKDLFTDRVDVDAIAPVVDGTYVLVTTENIPFLPDVTTTFVFGVSVNAAPPPKDPGGQFSDILNSLKWVAIAGAAIAGVVILAPAIMPVATQAGRSIALARLRKAQNE